MNAPTVSIITVCLNSELTIEATIRSALDQDYEHIEYVIVDGGSTDRTPAIIADYQKEVTTYISEPDEGIYDAMNKGIRLCTGDLVATLNSSDQYAHRSAVSQVVQFIESRSLDAAYGDLVYIDKKNPRSVRRRWKTGPYVRGAFRRGWAIPHPTFFCRKEVFESLGYFNSRLQIAADFELMLRFIERNQIKVGYLPETIAKMGTGGKANTISGVIRGNWEIIRAFRMNNIDISPWFFLLKPIHRINQILPRKKC